VYLNIALYQFAQIEGDLAQIRLSLLADGAALGVKGTVLLAPEGINAFLCGSQEPVKELLTRLGNTLKLSLERKLVGIPSFC
jgi:UPF0176 protein